MSHEARLAPILDELPPAPDAIGLYRPTLVSGGLLYTSGHLPVLPEGGLATGCLGDDLTVEQGAEAARRVGLAMLASLRKELGSLDNIDRLVKTFGAVRCTADFTDQPAVINGFSQLMKEVFGDEAGVGARTALGASSLPAGVPVEVEAVFSLRA